MRGNPERCCRRSGPFLFEEELSDLASLIEEKASVLSARIELLVTLANHNERHERRSGDQAYDDEGYQPSAGGLARLVEDMQYHDEACQRIACLKGMATDLRESLETEERATEVDPAIVLAMLERCHLGSFRERMKRALACRTGEDFIPQNDADEDESESVTLF
ncbi:MAG: hypothetical protein R3C97_02455 [Geminicoccaceae bacterium]